VPSGHWLVIYNLEVVQVCRRIHRNSTIIFHANASNKRWKLTILTAKPTDVEEVCEKVYLKESNFHRERSAEGKVQSRSYNNLSTV
jgi:hypothetical protein